MNNKQLENIFNRFRAEGSFLNAIPYGSGHIHDTFKVETSCSIRKYILQKINPEIFRDIEKLQNNISRVTDHLRYKLLQLGEKDIDRKCLTMIKTVDDKTWFRDNQGSYWRMFIFIPGHKNYEKAESPKQAYQGGKAIGKFQALLSDMPGPRLNETIPFFHDVGNRLKLFIKAIGDDPEGRAAEVKKEIEFVLSREQQMMTILNLGKAGKIPLRITHNDTKFNNILLDSNDNALCVIDLDTVMPGYIHYDFGDSIRTVANTADEDEEDPGKICLDLKLFRSYAEGYLEETLSVLNPTEKEYLYFAPSLITYTMGLRFLTDYIDGDRYYKIHKEKHNLIRARAQFRLVESNEEQMSDMKRIISDIIT